MRYYTDGSTYPANPGSGGIAVVVFGKTKNFVKSMFIGENITNNQAETKAILLAIELAIKHKDFNITHFTDSEYVMFGLRRIKLQKALLETNTDIWKEVREAYRRLSALAAQSKVTLEFSSSHVDGHSGIAGNDLADGLAYLASRHTEYEQFLLKEETDEFRKTIKGEKARRKKTA